MPHSLPYRILIAASIGQFAAWLLGSVVGAAAVPCCDNPSPEIPHWYALMSMLLHTTALLLPGFLCGLLVSTRPVLVGAIAGGVGAALWYWLGSFIIANLFPVRALGGLGQLEGVIYSLTYWAFWSSLVVSSLCDAAAAAAGASAGVLTHRRSP